MTVQIESPEAKRLVKQVAAKGFTVHAKPLKRSAKLADRYAELPGIRLTATPIAGKGKGKGTAVSVRDWLPERVELEAACLLAHHLDITITPIKRPRA